MSTREAISRAIEALGTQGKLAKAIGCSQGFISDLKRGRRTSISVEEAFAIERATGGAVRAEDFAAPAPPTPEPSPDERAA